MVYSSLPAFVSRAYHRFTRWLYLGLLCACADLPTEPTFSETEAYQSETEAYEAGALAIDLVVASIAVVPDSQMVFVNDQFKATGKPRNAAGQLLDAPVKWTVPTPTLAKALDSVGAIGTFKALRTGTASIKATSGGKSRTAKAVVRSTTGAKLVLTPATATVATGGTVKFTASGRTAANEPAGINATFTATGGTVSATGSYVAGTTTGTFRVIATARFGAADTSTVTITRSTTVARVILVPETATLAPGLTRQFAAYGRTSAGDSVAVSVTYSATGGTISTAGLYSAGGTEGTYRVIAKNAAGLADTSQVVISGGQVGGLTLMPDIAATRPGATTRFVARIGGVAVNEPVAYQASCGSITSLGVYTAPMSSDGTCRVTASTQGQSAATEVLLLSSTPGRGVPYGTVNMWATAIKTQSAAAPLNASHDLFPASSMADHIAAARANGVRLVLAMTGGSHDRYKTDCVFDESKWRAAMNAFNTAAIRAAVAEGVADGTIIGNSVMDEPQQADRGTGCRVKSWGPPGFMTKVKVDGLCAYVKGIFPTLPVGVWHDPNNFDTSNSYRICEFMVGQYALRKGTVTAWRDASLQIANRDGMEMIFSLNILDGGKQDRDGVYDCAGTGGIGTYSPNCRMLPQQVREWGKILGQSACTLLMWRYDATFMGKPENQAAFSDVATTMSRLPRSSCRRGSPPINLPPTAAFTSSCTNLDCSFTDRSTDSDGRVTGWTWNFGDGTSSTAQHPTHSYSLPGTYQVTLTAKDDDGDIGQITQSVTVTAPPTPNQPPTAAFATSCTNLSCSFDASGSSDTDGSISSYEWDFGDETPKGSGQTTTHTFSVAKTYTVTLTVTDNKGATGTISHQVTVTPANQPPTAAFSSSCTDLSCSFDASASGDTDGSISSYEWDFGDDSPKGSGQTTTHTYSVGKTYTVTLTVTDNKGATGTVSHQVTVTPANQPPTAAFSSSCTDLSCSFDASASGDNDGSISSYAWDFGDSSPAGSGQQPTHDYAAGGTYTVTLTVTDNKGATGTVSHQVTVTPANEPPTAAFTSSCTDLSCSFDASASGDTDGSISSYEWDFGDNSATGSGQQPTHDYAAGDTYTVTLTVTDNDGTTAQKVETITVTAPVATGGP